MKQVYVLWENTTGNAIGEFDTEGAAWAYVRTSLSAIGVEGVRTWLLSKEADTDDFEPELVAEGQGLIDRAAASIIASESARGSRSV